MLPLLVALGLFLISGEASAYTWMIRHGYTGCTTCHQDPSGGGILTPYGRALGGVVMRTRYGASEEADPLDDFLFGAVPLPEGLMLGGDLRGLWLTSKIEGVESRRDLFLMQADLAAAVRVQRFLASGSLGYAETGGFGAALTRAPEKNLVSRVHWLGYQIHEESGLVVRAGRMNLPFGIRNVEHTLWARTLTDTTINDDQQHGVAAAWSPANFRAELMAILGNYQIRPDAYRERGYSGYLEWLPDPQLALGASSLVTHRKLEPTYLRETWRHEHGIFARWASPWQPLVVLGEVDYAFRSPKNDFHRQGFVGFVQADVEATQGLHFLFTGEGHDVGVRETPFSWGAWVSQLWFVAPHVDLRIDNIYQSLGDEFGRTSVLSLLAQAHVQL